MAKVLVIKSSIFSKQGESSQLVDHSLAALEQQFGQVDIIERDFAIDPIAHLSGETMVSFSTEDTSDLSVEQRESLKLSNDLISELKSADYIIIGVPMYNFGIPSTLKAWIDNIARAGLTFNYTEAGPVGLVDNVKKVMIMAARGGIYQGTPKDNQTNYLVDVLVFMGIDNIEFVYAEALNMGEKGPVIEQAKLQIERIVSALD